MTKKKRPRPGQRQPGRQQRPQFQPIERLPIIASAIDGMLESDVGQYETLLQAKPKPWVLDNFTVGRVKKVFSEQRENFSLFDAQLRRWQELPTLTDPQRAEVTRLVGQMKELRENNQKVLDLADELSKNTIDSIMGKSDAEIGLEFLLGKFGNL